MNVGNQKHIPKIVKMDMKNKSTLQFALTLNDKSIIPKFVNYLKHNVIALHIKINDDYLVSHNDVIPIFKIPDSHSSLQKAAYFTAHHFTPSYNKSFASIAVGNDKVILNINHSMADGGYFKFLLKDFIEKYNSNPSNNDFKPKFLPSFPKETFQVFKDKLEKAPDIPLWADDPYITKVTVRNYTPKLDENDIRNAEPSYFTLKTNANSLMCYDKQQQKVKGYTETLWLSHILSTIVHNKKLDQYAGVSTCVDLRQWMKNQPDVSICNSFSVVNPHAPINKNMTLKEFSILLRKDLEFRLKRNEQYTFVKYISQPSLPGQSENKPEIQNSPPVVGLELTSMGEIQLHKPFTDAWVSLTSTLGNSKTIISLMSFGVKSEKKHEIIIRLRYDPHNFNEQEMKIYGKTINYFIHNISLNQKIGDAIEELTQFQKTLKQ